MLAFAELCRILLKEIFYNARIVRWFIVNSKDVVNVFAFCYIVSYSCCLLVVVDIGVVVSAATTSFVIVFALMFNRSVVQRFGLFSPSNLHAHIGFVVFCQTLLHAPICFINPSTHRLIDENNRIAPVRGSATVLGCCAGVFSS